MKKNVKAFLALLLACALLMPLMPGLAEAPANQISASQTGTMIMYIRTGNTGRLHLRQQPSTASASLGLYPNGTVVTVEAISNGWAYVTVGTQKGYMMLKFLVSGTPGPVITPTPLPTPIPTENTVMYVQTGNTGKLHLREQNSTSSRSLGLYPNGTAVTVTARVGTWAFVKVQNAVGYMMLKFLTGAPAPTPVPGPTVTVNPGTAVTMYVRTGNTGKLHLRENASTSAPSLGLYPNGTAVQANILGNGWALVSVNGKTGYMMTKYLTTQTPPATPTPAPTVTVQPGQGTTMYVQTGNTGRLHLREFARADAHSLGLYANGTLVTVLTTSGGWAQVVVQGQAGYMMLKFLTTVVPGTTPAPATPTPVPGAPTPTPLPAGKARVTQPSGSYVNMRSSQNSEIDNVIARIPSGTVVDIVERLGLWTKIRYDGKEGYMVSNYLK